MRVLWITNIVFPEATAILAGNSTLKSTGGWMLGAAEALLGNAPEIELAVASVSNRVNKLEKIQGKNITYYVLTSGKKYSLANTRYNKGFEPQWRDVYSDFKPDVVHIHGTENTHGLAYLRACGADNCVVSIQGLMSAYMYYDYGLKPLQILKNLSLFDIIRCNSILSVKRDFRYRKRYEEEMIKRVQHIIGRTDWDHSHVWAINPNAQYHFCNETLRKDFYTDECWNDKRCKKHTIFLSQATYPIKGLHQVLKALPLVLRLYPDTVVRIAGRDIVRKPKGLREHYFYSGYGNVIREMIKKNHLENCVCYMGNLDAEQMKQEYLHCNLFISPSTIENSPNSLGEAQLLGVPCLASYVGGTMNMIPSASCGELYRFEETEMLAWKICKMFRESDNFDNKKMVEEARRRHNREINAQQLLEIYTSVDHEGNK